MIWEIWGGFRSRYLFYAGQSGNWWVNSHYDLLLKHLHHDVSDALVENGCKTMYATGHSQGGSMALLWTHYALFHRQLHSDKFDDIEMAEVAAFNPARFGNWRSSVSRPDLHSGFRESYLWLIRDAGTTSTVYCRQGDPVRDHGWWLGWAHMGRRTRDWCDFDGQKYENDDPYYNHYLERWNECQSQSDC